MLLIYITYLTYYTKLKSQGKLVADHPVLKKLILLKTLLERIKSIDIKLKSQIDRLVRQSEEIEENKKNQGNEAYRLRSQILNEEENDDNNEGDEEGNIEEDENEKENKKKVMKYKVQKNMMEYFETKSENKKKNKKLEKMKEKIRNSEYFEDLKNKLGDNPLEVKSHLTEIVNLNVK